MQLNHKPSEFEEVTTSSNSAPLRIKRFLVRLLGFAILIGGGMLIGRLALLISGPASASTSLISISIGLPVTFVIAFYGSILIHELGHLIAGRLVNFQFMKLIVGPIMIGKGTKGLKISYSGFPLGGMAQLMPNDTRNLRRRFMWLYAGGPIATLFQFCVLLSIRYLMSDLVLLSFVQQLLTSFTFISLILLPFTILPLRFKGIHSDGLRIRIFLFDVARTEYLLALYQIVIASTTGTRLRDLDLEPLHNKTNLIKDHQDKFEAQLLYYHHVLDQDDPVRVGMALDECLDLLKQSPKNFLAASVFAEAAYYEAHYNRDTLISDHWLDLAERAYKKNRWVGIKPVLSRAESAVFLAENDPEEAYLAAQEGLKFLEQSSDQGYVLSERERLTRLVEEAKSLLEDPDVRPKPESWRESSPWLIAKSVSGTLLKMGIYFIIVLIILTFVLNRDLWYQFLGIYYIGTDNHAKAIETYTQGLEVADSDGVWLGSMRVGALLGSTDSNMGRQLTI